MSHDSEKDIPPYLQGIKTAKMEDVEELLKTGKSDAVPEEVKAAIEKFTELKGEPPILTKVPSSEEE